jgi:exonuclease SbcD
MIMATSPRLVRLVASGDHHFAEGPRLDECIRVHAWIAELVERERPGVFLSGGDVFDGTSTPIERHAVADFLVRIASVCPVVIAKGNHDRPSEVAFMGRLRAEHPIHVVESCGVVHVGDLAVACMAYPNKASVAAMLSAQGASPDIARVDQSARDCLANVLRGLGAQLAQHDGPTVLLGHFMIDGSVTSVGQPLIGAELNVTLADLALAGAHMTIAAHIHRPQEWSWGGSPILYCGSPYRTSFGETEEKSVIVADVADRPAEWQRFATPSRPMVLLDAEWTAGAFVHPNAPAFASQSICEAENGAEVRFRYRVDSDKREAARAAAREFAAELAEMGAHSVKIEEVVSAATRARAPQIAAARTLPDKLLALWHARGIDVADREGRLLEKIGEVA